jgi:hypothetical protein
MIYRNLQIIVRILKRRRVRWAGHVARTDEISNMYRMLVGKICDVPRWKRKHKSDLCFRKTSFEGGKWIIPAQNLAERQDMVSQTHLPQC